MSGTEPQSSHWSLLLSMVCCTAHTPSRAHMSALMLNAYQIPVSSQPQYLERVSLKSFFWKTSSRSAMRSASPLLEESSTLMHPSHPPECHTLAQVKMSLKWCNDTEVIPTQSWNVSLSMVASLGPLTTLLLFLMTLSTSFVVIPVIPAQLLDTRGIIRKYLPSRIMRGSNITISFILQKGNLHWMSTGVPLCTCWHVFSCIWCVFLWTLFK